MEAKDKIRVAVVGCMHGQLKDIVDQVNLADKEENLKTDLIVCCGDFEAIRDEYDLSFKACPDKYKKMGQFSRYYKGEFELPCLVIFVGGNHEASNLLDETYYGGWIWKNVFYLGRAGVVNYKGLRIAGCSGIYNENNYHKGFYEKDVENNIRSIYHIRNFDIARLNLIKGHIDMFLSHDWPTSIITDKALQHVLKQKPYWEQEIKDDTIGCPAYRYLIDVLQPWLLN